MNKVIGATQVQLREDAGPMEFLEDSRDQGKRIRELDSGIIEGPVVNAWPQASYPSRSSCPQRSLRPLEEWKDE